MISTVHTEKADLTRVQFFPGQPLEVKMLRLDKIHPVISGNKWFKLKEWISIALGSSKKGIQTFGGAYSNHLVAAAFAAKEAGIKSRGIIRGEKGIKESPTLLEAEGYGMEMIYVPRVEYRDPAALMQRYPLPDGWILIPEGGKGIQGVKGAAEILDLVPDLHQFSHICCAVGTGTMLAGICNAAAPHQQVTGISSLKGTDVISLEVKSWLSDPELVFNILFDYHFGGYAKHPAELINFMNQFYLQTGIPTDIVYTSKLMFGIHHLITMGYFRNDSKILAIHSGGLQGNRSLLPGKLIFL
jgi:1-aminocyclopropane-1-carboxylate deaminase